MAISKHYYKNEEITVLWQPGICTHSGICFKGLPIVFDPRKKPWIELGKVESLSIMNQVKKCPSGALSFIINEEKKDVL